MSARGITEWNSGAPVYPWLTVACRLVRDGLREAGIALIESHQYRSRTLSRQENLWPLQVQEPTAVLGWDGPGSDRFWEATKIGEIEVFPKLAKKHLGGARGSVGSRGQNDD